jgi:hypothetical protein
MTTRRNALASVRLRRSAIDMTTPTAAMAIMTRTASTTICPNCRPVATVDISRRNAKQGSSA